MSCFFAFITFILLNIRPHAYICLETKIPSWDYQCFKNLYNIVEIGGGLIASN